MDDSKRTRLRKRGWAVGSAQEFLGLDDEESAYVEMRLDLARLFVKRRRALGMTQREVADRLGSSQSRIAKIEAGDPSVSIDLMIRCLLGVGASRRNVGRAIGWPVRRTA